MIKKEILKAWSPIAFIIIVLCGLISLAVQQNFRQSANDPQIQMAEDAASRFQVNAQGKPVVAVGDTDIATSLAPYIVYFDESGIPTAGNGVLNGQLPKLPAGVFGNARLNGEDRFTWQPTSNIREAVVLVHIKGTTPGFVMAARSLREVEKREDALSFETGIALLVLLLGSLALYVFLDWQNKKKEN